MNLAHSRRRNSLGFTLIEVIIALTVVAIALFGLISVITYTSRSNLATTQRTIAMRAAERKVEQMLSNTATAATFFQVMNDFDHTASEVISGLATGYEYDNVEGLLPMTGQTFTIFVEFPRAGAAGSHALNETIAGAGFNTVTKDPGWMDLGLIPAGYPNAGTSWTNVDLNGDGVYSTSVASTTCLIIPARIRVRWKGVYGDAELVYKYTFLKKP